MRAVVLSVLALFVAASAFAADAPTKDQKQAAPEAATSGAIKPLVIAQKHMVVAANPYAAEAGRDMLRQGGSAMDAAIATQLVLNLVEPQSSGIGGGAFIVTYDAKTKQVGSIDGRETAPTAAKPDRFLLPDGKERPFEEAVNSGLSSGVPGVVSALALGHRTHGKLPWRKLFEPAIALAENGFVVSPRLAKLLAVQGPDGFNAEAKALYFDAAGKPRQAGETLKNPALAETLRALAAGGADAFYKGQIAMQMLRELAAAPRVPGDMTAADLSGYSAKERDPVCVTYSAYRVCGMGPPSSGGTTVAMVLGLLEARKALPNERPAPHQPLTGIAALLERPDTAVGRAIEIAEAEKLAYADRDQYIADPEFVPQPSTLTDQSYLASRAKLIDLAHPMIKALPGTPPMKTGWLFGADATVEHSGTSHISIVDDDGNAVAMTTTIETAFGSRLMAGGFLLNNQLTDFSFKPADDKGWPIANRVEPGKRPRSSLAPTIVLRADGTLYAVLGAPGGSRIILYDVKSLVCLIEWACNAEEAADLPAFGSRNGPFEVEQGTTAETILGPLAAARGEVVKAVDMNTGVHIIVRRDGHLEGGADHRREGVALGD
jgi:gamma-glutamyltranspeptidase / glutathione hydrolase